MLLTGLDKSLQPERPPTTSAQDMVMLLRLPAMPYGIALKLVMPGEVDSCVMFGPLFHGLDFFDATNLVV